MYGFAGKIARINLSTKKVTLINTEDYSEWTGGHGLAAALFFDIVNNKAISGFDPENVLVIAPGYFSGTLVPSACRTEMVGIQVQAYPYEWFCRSNAGGRFANMLKYAGFDAITIEGVAEKPTWINIIEGDIYFEDATGLWGLDTFETQQVVFKEINDGMGFNKWNVTKGVSKTTQMPSVICIGQAGENLSRLATVQTDAGNAFGQGGFGAVWGSKKLKAISAYGTGSIEIADPKGLMEARLWAVKNYATNYEDPKLVDWGGFITSHFSGYLGPHWTPQETQRRPSGCDGCPVLCRPKTSSGYGNESVCVDPWYRGYDLAAHGKYTDISGITADMVQRLGINVWDVRGGATYLEKLYKNGIAGKGKQIDTDLPFDKLGELEFAHEFLYGIAYRKGIGDDLAEGLPRAAKRWGRLEEDLATGLLTAPYWGFQQHYDMRTEVYWGYATILADRDVNCHDFNIPAYRLGSQTIPVNKNPLVSAQWVADVFADLPPYNDADMMNFADDNIYSIHMARTVAWLLHYSRFWKQSCGLCDNAFADFVNQNGPNNRGLTPEGELKFYKAVSGNSLSFEDSMEMGRKILNLDRSIWSLQGRHRDMEQMAEYVFAVANSGNQYFPVKEGGQWEFKNLSRSLDKNKFEEFKDTYFDLQGWDKNTGIPTRSTLEELNLDEAANELEAAGKLVG